MLNEMNIINPDFSEGNAAVDCGGRREDFDLEKWIEDTARVIELSRMIRPRRSMRRVYSCKVDSRRVARVLLNSLI